MENHQPTVHGQTLKDDGVREEALKLIALAYRMMPEGEGLDLADRDYTMVDMINLKDVLSTMRSTIDAINAALAHAWRDNYGIGASIEVDGKYRWLGANKKWKIQPGQERKFAEWLVEQPTVNVAEIVPPYAIRVGVIDRGVRDALLTNEPTSDDVRIQSKPVTKEKQ